MDISLLCFTLSGLRCDLLTITDPDEANSRINERRCIFLSARVHPGESNSSHIMHGIIKYLLGDSETAGNLRRRYVFKIIPMLNPDGVYFGNHRTGMTGEDLNRQWLSPDKLSHPTIYWAKQLLEHMAAIDNLPVLCVDIHGHSRRKNVFMFGNDPLQQNPDSFPCILSRICDNFDLAGCQWTIDSSKEGTARVVWFKELGIKQSFTLESSYCGSSIGEMKGLQYRIADLNRFGEEFCEGIYLSEY